MALLTYLAVAALLLWLTGIVYRPIGRVAALTLLLTPLALSGPALVAGRVLGPIDLPYWSEPLAAYRELLGPGPFSPPVLNDVSSQMIPWRTAVRSALAAGEWPLWNPSILNGDILLASGQPAALAPLSLAELLLPPALAIGFSATLTLFVAALGTFLFLRHVRVSVAGSLLGAVAWSWSGFLIFWLHWPQGRSAAHLPWILLAVSWLVRRNGVRPLLALAALLANLLLSGHPETALHVVALGGAFAIFRLARRSRRQRLPALVRGLSAGALALMLAALFWLPVAAALLESHELPLRRSHPERWSELSMSESAPKLLPHFAPLVFGQSSVNEGTTPDGWALPGTSYIGSAVLPLILVGAFAVRFRHRAFAIGLALFCLAAAVSAPPVVWLLQRLPLFSIALNERLAFGAAFGLAWCAAIGFDRLFGAMSSRAPELGRSGGTLVAVFTALAVAILVAVLAVGGELSSLFGVPESFRRVESIRLLAAACCPALVFLLRRRGGVACALLLAALLAQRRSEAGFLYPSFPAAAFAPRVEPIASIPDVRGLYRVVGVGFQWLPNSAILDGLEDPRGYQAVTLGRFAETAALWSAAQPSWFHRVDSPDRPFLRFLGVRYALVPNGAFRSDSWRLVASGRGGDLLENRRAALRFFVPEQVRFGGDRQKLLAELREESNFVRRVRIEPMESAAEAPAEPVTIRNPKASVTVRPRGTGYEVEVETPRAVWVASSVAAWSGWRARRDGRDLRLGYANHAFLAFEAPEGRSVVEVRYRPRAFDLGLAISGLGGLAFAGLAFAARRSRRALAPGSRLSSRTERASPGGRAAAG